MRHRTTLSSHLKLEAAAFAAAALILGVSACGGSGDSSGTNPDQWRIGLEAPLSGQLKTLGEGMLNGARLAADQINADGGLEGKDVEIVPIDDGGDPTIGVPAAKKAIADGLDGVVGPYNSGVGIETLPLYKHAGLVPIRLTSDNDTAGFGFTLQPMSSQIAPVTSDALASWIGARTVAITYDPTQNYTKEVSRAVRSDLESGGVKVTAFEPVQPGKNDYSNVVDKLASENPDAIYAAVYYPEGALIAKAMGALNSGPTCLLDYASYDTGYLQDAGKAAAGNCDVVGVPAPDDFEGSAPMLRLPGSVRPGSGNLEPLHLRLSEHPGGRGQTGWGLRRQPLDQRARKGEQLEGLDGLGHPRARKRQP